jgi:hypothetical protein
MRSIPLTSGIPCSPPGIQRVLETRLRDRPPPARSYRFHHQSTHARTLARELEPANAEGRRLRVAIIVDARDKLLVFLTRRDVEPTNNACSGLL